MLCEKKLGNLNNYDCRGKAVEYVDIEWHEAFKRVHKKTTDKGREIGIRMDDSILTQGLLQDDIIYDEDSLIIAVNTPPCDVIEISLLPGLERQQAKVCYEIGNRHGSLFFGKREGTFITIYDEPMMTMLSKIHGAVTERKTEKLDFAERISNSVHNHHH